MKILGVYIKTSEECQICKKVDSPWYYKDNHNCYIHVFVYNSYYTGDQPIFMADLQTQK